MTNDYINIASFKMALFDLSVNHQEQTTEKKLEQLTAIIQKTTQAKHIEMVLHHLQVMTETATFYGGENSGLLKKAQKKDHLQKALIEKEIYEVREAIGQMDTEGVFICKLGSIDVFEGFILFTFPQDQWIDKKFIVEICRQASAFIAVIEKKEVELIEKDRHTHLIKLASQLIGLNRTEDVLEVMMDSIRAYLPHHTYQIWMLKEVDYDGLPIKQINQKKLLKD